MNYLEIEHEIRRYIRENPGTTANRVAGHLSDKRLLSYAPARKRVLHLIEGGIVEDRKEGNSFHRLFINEKNNFNKIDTQLTEIENGVNEWDKIANKVNSQETKRLYEVIKRPYEYYEYFLLLLRILLVYTAERIQSETYKKVLYGKIIKLIVRIDRQLWRDRRRRSIYFYASRIMDRRYNKKAQYAKSLDNLRTKCENLQEQMLSLGE